MGGWHGWHGWHGVDDNSLLYFRVGGMGNDEMSEMKGEKGGVE